jgi:hypothetical protein
MHSSGRGLADAGATIRRCSGSRRRRLPAGAWRRARPPAGPRPARSLLLPLPPCAPGPSPTSRPLLAGMLHDLQKLPHGLAADILGMGTWRLKGAIDGAINFVTGRIENSFRELLQHGGGRAALGGGAWAVTAPGAATLPARLLRSAAPSVCCAGLGAREPAQTAPADSPAARAAELTLYPPPKWKERGWDFIDSSDPQREWDGW